MLVLDLPTCINMLKVCDKNVEIIGGLYTMLTRHQYYVNDAFLVPKSVFRTQLDNYDQAFFVPLFRVGIFHP